MLFFCILFALFLTDHPMNITVSAGGGKRGGGWEMIKYICLAFLYFFSSILACNTASIRAPGMVLMVSHFNFLFGNNPKWSSSVVYFSLFFGVFF